MKHNHLQLFNQQRYIEDQIVKKWGYQSIRDQPTFQPSTKMTKFQNRKSLINSGLQPRDIEKIQVPKSAKYTEFLQQMQNIQYEKNRTAQKQRNNGKDFQPIKMINQRIKQYNYVVEHRHLRKPQGSNVPKKFQIKNSTELIVQQIGKKHQQLMKVEDLSSQYKINKGICQLYRDFNNKMFSRYEKSANKQSSRRVSTSDSKNTSSQKYRKNSLNMTAIAFSSRDKSQFSRIRDRRQNINIKDPMNVAAQIKRNKQIEDEQKLHKRKKQVYKHKVEQRLQQYIQYQQQKSIRKRQQQKKVKKLSFQQFLQEEYHQEKTQRQQNPLDSLNIQLLKDKQDGSEKKKLNDFYLTQMKENHEKQFLYISEYLGKKNRKFKKPWGNKILIKYDSVGQAKQMLDGRQNIKSAQSNRQVFNSTGNSFSKTNRLYNAQAAHSRLEELQTSLKCDEKQIQDQKLYVQILQAQNDQKHDQRKYKNEKYNQFLGRHK